MASEKALFQKNSKDALGKSLNSERHRQEFVWQRNKPFKAHIPSTRDMFPAKMLPVNRTFLRERT